MRYSKVAVAALVVGVLGYGGAVQAESSHAHGHEQTVQAEVGSKKAPSIRIEVTADATSGWNLRLATENFRFAPENASGPHVPQEGHAHLFVDGEKVTRLYGPWFHIPELAPGEHQIMVTLNANDHRAYAVGATPIRHMVKVTVARPSG